MIDEIHSTNDSIEVGLIFLNSSDLALDDSSPECQAMDKAIEQNMLEFLKDDLSKVVAEDRNTGGLLAHDEKVGIERLIESLQLVQWSNMVMAKRPQKESKLL